MKDMKERYENQTDRPAPTQRGKDETAPASDRRRHIRRSTILHGTLHIDARDIDCIILDLSVGGAKILIKEPVYSGARTTLSIDRVGAFSADVVWTSDEFCGLLFTGDNFTISEKIGRRFGLE